MTRGAVRQLSESETLSEFRRREIAQDCRIVVECCHACSKRAIRALCRVWSFNSQGQAGNGKGGPLTYSARTDLAVFGAGATGELLPAACAGNPACLANAYNPSATTGHQGGGLELHGQSDTSSAGGGQHS
jgi:hypothetical protein